MSGTPRVGKVLEECHVHEQHEVVRASREAAKLRELGYGAGLSIGDYCLATRPLCKGQRLNFDEVFQEVEVNTPRDGEDPHLDEAKTYVLSDLRGERENLGFTQPVARERLTPIEMTPLSQTDDIARTRISLRVNGQFRLGTIKNQMLDGRVMITLDDELDKRCVNLSREEYRWI